MRQVLFWLGPVPIYGFGMMLFLTFAVCYWLIGKRTLRQGIAKQYGQDLAVWIFIGGLIGARIWFMAQYRVPIWDFYRIWEGGLVFYGAALGGTAAFFLAYYLIVRKHGLDILQLGDILAPVIALGLSLGRIGCLLNGCCYGHVACPDCFSVHFPLSAPARFTLVQAGLQTAAGFSTENPPADPRSLVTHVEPGSPADQNGLRRGDVVTEVEGIPNQQKFLEVWGTKEQLTRLPASLGSAPEYIIDRNKQIHGRKYEFTDQATYQQALQAAQQIPLKGIDVYDGLWEHLVNGWPRGQTELKLAVQHADGKTEQLPGFNPVTLGLHPTQLYETISTFLIFLLLLAYEPFQKRKGELLVILMLCYSVHRFINESLRNDTAKYSLFDMALTISQWGSIILLVAGVALLLWLVRRPVEPARTPAQAEEQIQIGEQGQA